MTEHNVEAAVDAFLSDMDAMVKREIVLLKYAQREQDLKLMETALLLLACSRRILEALEEGGLEKALAVLNGETAALGETLETLREDDARQGLITADELRFSKEWVARMGNQP